jgi:hypothetical protein
MMRTNIDISMLRVGMFSLDRAQASAAVAVGPPPQESLLRRKGARCSAE